MVPITTKFDDLSDEAKMELFDNVIKEYMEYRSNMSDHQTIAAVNAAMKAIAKLHRSFKSKLVNRYLAKGVAPFKSYNHLKPKDWDAFVQMKSSEQFKKESEKKKQLWAKNKHDHKTGAAEYTRKRVKW